MSIHQPERTTPTIPDTMPYTDEERKLARQKQRENLPWYKKTVVKLAGVGLGLAGIAAGGYAAAQGGGETEPKVEPSASAPANPGEKEAPVISNPSEAVGITQTSYDGVNTAEAANNPDLIKQALEPVAENTPLDKAAELFGEKFNMYILTGNEDILKSIYGEEAVNAEQPSEVIEETKELHGHNNNRMSYFNDYKPNQIVDKDTGKQVDVTAHEAFEPLEPTGDLSIKITELHDTNFEAVDRADVFDNPLLDSSFTKEKELVFKIVDGNLVLDTILYAN